MLREITAVSQDDPRLVRRWFQDEYFDLFVWLTREGKVSAFQLGYGRAHRERALSWSGARGFSHARVDVGEDKPWKSMTPLLVPGGSCPIRTLLRELERRSADLEDSVRMFLLAKLRLGRRLRRLRQSAESPGDDRRAH